MAKETCCHSLSLPSMWFNMLPLPARDLMMPTRCYFPLSGVRVIRRLHCSTEGPPCRPPSWMRWWHTYWVIFIVVAFLGTCPRYSLSVGLDRMEVRLFISAMFIVLNYWLY